MLDVNPFDEPNVQQAKDATRRAIGSTASDGAASIGAPEGTLSDGVTLTLTEASREGLGAAARSRFSPFLPVATILALHRVLGPDPELAADLQELRNAVSRRTPASTMLGYGPRYLHSTGQLHKGRSQQRCFRPGDSHTSMRISRFPGNHLHLGLWNSPRP